MKQTVIGVESCWVLFFGECGAGKDDHILDPFQLEANGDLCSITKTIGTLDVYV